MGQYNHPDNKRSSKDYIPGPYGGKKEDKLSNKQGNNVIAPPNQPRGNDKV